MTKPDVRPPLSPEGLFRRIPFLPHQLVDDLTPAPDLFVLSHLGVPRLAPEDWTLDVAGMVERPLRLTFRDLARFPLRSVEAFHQCAGNPMEPVVPTRRIANVRWSGVALCDVLALAGPLSGADFIWSFGADHGTFDGDDVPYFLKDLPLARVNADVLLATKVNDVPLSAENGFPVRLVVPGFYGTNSVKWLYRLEVARGRAQGLFTTRFYNDRIGDELRPVWAVAPEAVIVSPGPNAVLAAGETLITGRAWADEGVTVVEISLDGGATWEMADLAPRRERAWQSFCFAITLSEGAVRILCRATDTRGVQQPMCGARNAVHGVDIRVDADAGA